MHFKKRSAFFFEMTGKEIIKYLEEWAPKGIAWDKDNVGLQVGDPEIKIKNVLLSLDLKEQVIESAIKENCNLIITHHPLLYYPLKNLDYSKNIIARMIEKLIKNNITLYSAHTNLDFTKHGVSYQLAKKLLLKNIRFLKNLSDNQIKLTVFVPESHVNKVAEAIHQAGGGLIGEYSHCSFKTSGTGTFKGSNESNPAIGKKGVVEFVEEVKEEVKEEEPEPEPFVVVEEMPMFPGGDPALLQYIAEHTNYPEVAKENNIQGRVIVRFCVTSKGGVNQVSVLKGVDPELDKEAMRVVESLPAFKPGKQGGKPVPVWYMVPITFTLK